MADPTLKRDGSIHAVPYVGEDTDNDGVVDKVPTKLYGEDENGNLIPIKFNPAGQVEMQQVGSIVEQADDGKDVMRTKIITKAYDSWDFDGQAEITIPAGSYVMESTTRNVNGYSTLAFILRCLDNKDVSIRIEALWLSTSGSYNTFRRATEVLHDGTTFAYSACGAVTTKAENVVIALVNNDTVDRAFHLHMFMR